MAGKKAESDSGEHPLKATLAEIAGLDDSVERDSADTLRAFVKHAASLARALLQSTAEKE